MDPDTGIGGTSSRFPTTRRSAILEARSADPALRERGLTTIVDAYWKPVYKYVRWKWRQSNEDAKDTTQAFFALTIEKHLFEEFDAARGKFRTYLRVCVDGFVSNEHKAAHRKKRTPAAGLLSLDFETAEGELRLDPPADQLSTEEFFEREWIRSLFSRAVDDLRADCIARGKETAFRLFEIYDLADDPGREPESYGPLAARFGIPVHGVTNALAFLRREFRRIVLAHLREETGSDEEFRREARALLGGGKRR